MVTRGTGFFLLNIIYSKKVNGPSSADGRTPDRSAAARPALREWLYALAIALRWPGFPGASTGSAQARPFAPGCPASAPRPAVHKPPARGYAGTAARLSHRAAQTPNNVRCPPRDR